MRSRLVFVAVVSVATLGSACSEKRERRRVEDEEVASSTSTVAVPLPSQSASIPRDPPPQIEIGLAAIRVDDELAGSPKPIEEKGRLQRIDELFDKLKALREKWKTDHPTGSFAGVVGIRVDPETKLIVFKSVFQTAAYAGYPNISVMEIGKPKTILDLDAQIPGPPNPSAEPAPIERILHVHDSNDANERRVVWKHGSTVVSETLLPSDNAEATKKICEEWSMRGVHTNVTDLKIDDVIVHFENDEKFADAMPLLAGIASCERTVERAGKQETVPAFRITFSIR